MIDTDIHWMVYTLFGGCAVIVVYVVSVWLLTRGDQLEEEERAAAIAPLLVPTESSPA